MRFVKLVGYRPRSPSQGVGSLSIRVIQLLIFCRPFWKVVLSFFGYLQFFTISCILVLIKSTFFTQQDYFKPILPPKIKTIFVLAALTAITMLSVFPALNRLRLTIPLNDRCNVHFQQQHYLPFSSLDLSHSSAILEI